MNQNKKRSHWASRLGFLLATAGSAVGLGNLWKFPYMAGLNGGFLFIVVSLVVVFLIGMPVMMSEMAIGRNTQKGPVGAYSVIDKRYRIVGILPTAVAFLILSYYSVIGGWVLKYLFMYVTGGIKTADTAAVFASFVTNPWEPILWHFIFMGITISICYFGINAGIERASKVLMPALVLLILGIGIYTTTLDGAFDGVAYYLLPNFDDFTAEKLFKTIAAASSQLFYSMSISMGILVTYGSYMRKEDSLESSVRQIEIFDTGVALLAGLIIVPSVFAFSGGDHGSLNAGPGLMFITLPKVFESMPAGNFIGAAFFMLVSLAALTSSISLMETVVFAIMDKFRLSRVKSCIIVVIITLALGMLSVLGYSDWSDVTLFGMQFLDFFDFITNSVMMPILALLTCILIGYVVKTKYVEEEVLHGEKKFSARGVYRIMIRFVCPVFMVIILLTPFFTDI